MLIFTGAKGGGRDVTFLRGPVDKTMKKQGGIRELYTIESDRFWKKGHHYHEKWSLKGESWAGKLYFQFLNLPAISFGSSPQANRVTPVKAGSVNDNTRKTSEAMGFSQRPAAVAGGCTKMSSGPSLESRMRSRPYR